ncbi:DUF1877 family protein [Tuwongella immobilis]|uniref:DUF1877 domain-containing protein n=1 Tax=Tuwongella immobilis TaxID=692036 RepID=A0A6C2YW61_9BACT|nr:DUF1877 family protein [Tuwongella immobilis]VIP05102.1 Uncharacterized protein OS=Cardiobacterium valvarum F0432 GN=HMPREF9080_02025 PE=4 SV=1: DUF1877 [Tuwongella immobilis]VTS07560.1 Uncharacterized protein OS=Cardiobacterium valvarum F0432 GN=HMPREF9080_02025 PE=4 SV=1: DUF1877 [Tuwongella immobilis]
MACLGSHFAITAEMAEQLTRDWPSDYTNACARLEDMQSQFYSLHAEEWVERTGKAWDGIHRSLTDGKLELGRSPRHLCILGATERYFIRRDGGQLEYIVNILDPASVRRVADAIRSIDRAGLLQGYEGIDPDSFYARYAMSEQDFEYTWEHFQSLQAFFERAAIAGRWVVFRVDQ